MSYRVAHWLAVAAVLTLHHFVVSDAVAQTSSDGRIVARHGDWQIRCEQPLGAPSEECALVQNVAAADRPNVSLTVVFLETADGQARILRVLAPHGVLLPKGLGLSIDDQMIGYAEYMRCLQGIGCIAEVALDDGLLERFEAGAAATFVIFLTAEEGIGIPISLDGFTAGFAALQNPAAETRRTVEPADPRPPVETSTRVVGAAGPSDPPTFEIPADDRTAIDRLLEDDLFPIVAGAAGGLVLLLFGVLALALGGRRRKRRLARRAREEPVHAAEDDEEDTDLDDALTREDDDEEEEEDLARPRRPAGRRAPQRLAGPPERRQLTYDPLDEIGDVVVAQTGRGADHRPDRGRTRR